jgi:predicted nucleotidyltransferase
MRMIKPLDVVDSGSKLLILRELSITAQQELNEVQIAQAAGIHQTTVHKYVWDLVQEGIVLHRKVGRANLFMLNPYNELSNRIKKLFEFENNLKEELIAKIETIMEKDQNVLLAYLFGSVAKNQDTPTSDIDVFIVAKNKRAFDDTYPGSREVHAIETRYSKRLNFHSISYTEFKDLTKNRNPLIKEVEDTGVRISGKNIFELKQGAPG